MGDGTKKETTAPELEYTYATAGDFKISVEAIDSKKATSKSSALLVYAGNEAPAVSIGLTAGNHSFYLPGTPLNYTVTVTDKTDTAAIDPANLFVSVDYLEGFDKAALPMGHQQGTASISGKNLIFSMDCKSCHKEAEKSIGPSFVQVSEKYAKDPNVVSYLTQKIIKGGGGVWGDVAMAAHPTLTETDAHQMIGWIMSLTNKAAVKKSLPATGSIVPPVAAKPNSVMLLSASYTDKGGNNIKALTGSKTFSLHSNTIAVSGTEKLNGFKATKLNGNNALTFPGAAGWFAMDSIDLTGVAVMNINLGWQTAPNAGVSFEAGLDAPGGTLLGKGTMVVPAKGQQGGLVKVPVTVVSDGKFHTVYFVYKGTESLKAIVTSVQFGGRK